MTGQKVVLLHGIFRTGRSMRRIEKALKGAGYETLNITFPSTKLAIEEIVELIHPQITAFGINAEKLSFIGYSMGGLVIRAYLHKYRPQNLFRVVMLGTPNRGSELADRVNEWKLYRKLYGPAGGQLVTDQQNFKSIFGIVDYELGVIAGSLTVEPISSLFLPWPNDGKVSVASTKIEGMKEHLVLRVPHSYLTISPRIRKATLQF